MFMSDYLQSKHMELILPTADQQPIIFLLYHHVCKSSSTTTKLRVVFDGSCNLNNRQSLNDFLHNGPKLQRDIVSILTKYQLPVYVFSADIKQMFRQIIVHPKDKAYQCII